MTYSRGVAGCTNRFNYVSFIHYAMTGRLFTFEGIDGSGKTTISHLVGKQLSENYDVVWTKEPTDSWIGKAVNRAVEEELDSMTVTLLFTADRYEHVKQIQSWLHEGRVVLCDRYIHSTLAYQSVSLSGTIDKPSAWIRTLHQPFFLQPTLTFLFVLDVKTALQRIADRVSSPFERAGFLSEVQQQYLRLAETENFTVLDATEKKEMLADSCARKIREKIGG